MTTPPAPLACSGPRLGRRGFLLGLSAAMALGRSRLAFGQAPGEAGLVVVILRGGMDGLSAVPAYGDPAFAALRTGLLRAALTQIKRLIAADIDQAGAEMRQ